jgi:ABC-type transporter Mla subunit MlaD
MDQDSVKLGLLVAAAQTHQKLAEAAIEKLNEHTRGLDAVARDQIPRALADGLKGVHAETQGAVEALQRVKRAANARTVFWTLGVTAIALGVALFVAWWVLPTPAEIAALRTERDALASNIALLNERGARADVRRCGTVHLCVRVDVKAPRYGEASDYLVIRGY